MLAKFCDGGLAKVIIGYDACHAGLVPKAGKADRDIGLCPTYGDVQAGALQQPLVTWSTQADQQFPETND